MKRTQTIQFVIACFLAIAVFVAYQTFYGDTHNQAYASLTEGDETAAYVNYKPARKREIRTRLQSRVDSLLELKGHDIMQIFDAPELVRRELPTTIWQYRNGKCVMDVYFTVGQAGDVSRANVAHYELRARDLRSDKGINASDCIQDLVKRNAVASLIDVKAIYKASAR